MYNKILSDLNTFSKRDINILFSFYHVSNIPDLISKIYKICEPNFRQENCYNNFPIYKKGNINSADIFDAIKENNMDRFTEIVNSPGFNINIQDGNGNTALISTLMGATNKKLVREKRKEMAKYLMDHGANLNIQNNKGNTALIVAINKENDEIAKYLVDHGANLNIQNQNGTTALMWAIKDNNIKSREIAKYLVDHGADLNLQNTDGNTALILAIKNDEEEIIKYLIDGPPENPGANLNIQNHFGNTALIWASKKNNENGKKIIKYLIGNGADLNLQNQNGTTAATLIDKNNDIELLLWLIDNDIQISKEIRKNMPHYIELKKRELKIQIKELRKLLDEKEMNILEENKSCHQETIDELERCKKFGENMIKYKPGGKKMRNLEEKYMEHPYFSLSEKSVGSI